MIFTIFYLIVTISCLTLIREYIKASLKAHAIFLLICSVLCFIPLIQGVILIVLVAEGYCSGLFVNRKHPEASLFSVLQKIFFVKGEK